MPRIGFCPKEDIDALNLIYGLRDNFGPPDRYLGANFEKVQLYGGRIVWSTNCIDYLNSSIKNVKNSLVVDKYALKNCGNGHIIYSSSYRSELEITEGLVEELANIYQQLVGVVGWLV